MMELFALWKLLIWLMVMMVDWKCAVSVWLTGDERAEDEEMGMGFILLSFLFFMFWSLP